MDIAMIPNICHGTTAYIFHTAAFSGTTSLGRRNSNICSQCWIYAANPNEDRLAESRFVICQKNNNVTNYLF